MDSLRFERYFLAHLDGFLKLLSIPSVYDETTADPEHPYGASVHDALCFMKSCCEEIGMEVRMYGNAALSASFGEGERIDIASHLDVVEPGEGWDGDPFTPVVKDGAIYARGSQDMKSGAWLTYLALKMLKEEGVCFTKELRLVYGTDEERTMDDLRLYVKEAGLPAFAFTPDGQFPITIGEKGALMWILEKEYSGCVHELKGGVQPNVVSPQADALVKGVSMERIRKCLHDFDLQGTVTPGKNGMVCIHTEGRSAHASTPEKGHSATTDLLKILAAVTEEEDLKKLYELSGDLYGKTTGLAYRTEEMGSLTMNPGILDIENGRIRILLDCRYPAGVTHEQLDQKLRSYASEYTVTLPYIDPPALVDAQDPYVRVLKDAYRKVLRKEAGTFISGGVSYAKVYGHCVNFGTVAETSEKNVHQRNENIRISDCVEALEIYYEALKGLMEAV